MTQRGSRVIKCYVNKISMLQVWTWGKGDYYRLGHGVDQHVRKPTLVEGLRGKKIVHVAVGALHCLAVSDTGQVCQQYRLWNFTYMSVLLMQFDNILYCGC